MTKSTDQAEDAADDAARHSYIHALRHTEAGKHWWRPLGALVVVILMALPVAGISAVLVGTLAAKVIGDPGQTFYNFFTIPEPTWPIEGFMKVISATMIVICPASLWFVFHVGRAHLASLRGSFRWHWFWTVLAGLGPFMVVAMLLQVFSYGAPVWSPSSLMALGFLASFLLTPLQATGEELLFRAWGVQVFGSWFRNEKVAWVVLSVVLSIVFSAAHLDFSPEGFLDRVVFGLCAAYLVWLTQGIEAAVVFHAITNMVLEMFQVLAEVPSENESYVWLPTILAIITDIGAVLVVVWLWHRYRRRHDPRGSANGPGSVAVSTPQLRSRE